MLSRRVKILSVFMAMVALCGCSKRLVYEISTDAPPTSSTTININTATAAELEKLPHIGRKTAETIVQFRDVNGPFRRPEYLMQIHGISEKRFAEIRQYITTQ